MAGGAAIITGASEGIGRGLALAFARRGISVGLLARRGELLTAVAEECRQAGAPRAEFRAVDVTDTEKFRAALGELDRALGETAYFVANAGTDAEMSRRRDCGDEARRVFDLNLIAAVIGLEWMKAAMVKRGSGTLAAVSSVAGARGMPFGGPYCASKAALTVYLESLRIELKPLGVRVTDILPGFIDTAMTRGAGFPMPFLMPPETAGELYAKAILRGRPRYIAPWPYRGVYWLMRVLPNLIWDWAGGRMVRARGRGPSKAAPT